MEELEAVDWYQQRLEATPDTQTPEDEAEIGGLSWVSFHPSLSSRLKRLRAMGAHVEDDRPRKRSNPAGLALLIAIVAPLAVLMAVLLGLVVVLTTGLTVVFMMIPLAIVYAVFELLF